MAYTMSEAALNVRRLNAKKGGQPKRTIDQAENKFWNKVDKSGDCWIWTAVKDRGGYGLLRASGKMFRAHRLSWYFVYREMPKLHVLHKCDNPACVNPSHLFLGTHQDNMADMINKGRSGLNSCNKFRGSEKMVSIR